MEYVFSEEPISATVLAKSFSEAGIGRTQIIRFLTEKGYIEDIRTVTDYGLANGVQYMYGDNGAKWPVYDARIQKIILDHIDTIKSYEMSSASTKNTTKIPETGVIITPDATITEFVKSNSFSNETAYKTLVELGYVIKDQDGKGYIPTELGICNGILTTKNKRGFKMITYPANVQREILQKLGIITINEQEKPEIAPLALTLESGISVQVGLILCEYPLLGIDNFVVIDTETTGMTADDEVIELAVVNMDGTVLYDSTFCPKTEVSCFASAVNHITTESLCDSPEFAGEWNKIKALIGNKKILAHNASFDKRMIKQTLEKYNMDASVVETLFCGCYDSKSIVKKHIELGSYSLENIAHDLGIKRAESHRAADDCIMTLEVLSRLEILLSSKK